MGNKVIYILLNVLLMSYINRSDSLLKKFVSSWDISNEKNWKNGRIPCSNSETLLDENPHHSILIDNNIQVDSLRLNYDSTFIIADDKILSFGYSTKGSCHQQQKKVSFKNKAKGFWWDPDSWSCNSKDILECNSATPHVTRVPCDRDSVRFPDPNKSLYEVIFSGQIPTVKELRISNDSYYTRYTHTSQFTTFAMTTHGKKMMKKRSGTEDHSYVYIEDTPECSSTGCSCHAVSPEREVCKIMSKKCENPQCENPIYIKGFCCHICGSSLKISHNNSLDKVTVQNFLRNFLSTKDGVNGHLASLEDGFYEVIFVPNEFGENYIETSELFKTEFNNKINVDEIYSALLVTSGESFTNIKYRSSNTVAYVIILMAIFVIGAVVGAVYVKKYRRNDLRNFDFRRFSLRSRRESTLSTVTISSGSTGHGIRFTNPIFNVPEAVLERHESSGIPELPEAETPTQRSNPLFDVEEKKVISLSTLIDKLEPDIEKEIKNRDKFEKLSTETFQPGYSITRIKKRDMPPEMNTLVERDQSLNDSQPILVSTDINALSECNPPFQSNPFDSIPKNSDSIEDLGEEKVEIESLDAVMTLFKDEIVPTLQNESTDSEENIK